MKIWRNDQKPTGITPKRRGMFNKTKKDRRFGLKFTNKNEKEFKIGPFGQKNRTTKSIEMKIP